MKVDFQYVKIKAFYMDGHRRFNFEQIKKFFESYSWDATLTTVTLYSALKSGFLSIMKIKLLLVDDEKEFVEVLSDRLEVRGFDVKTALSGEEALKWIYTAEFDVVLLDVMLPGDNGIEILTEIKRARPLIQIIMLTGHAKIDTAVRGIELGAYDYLLKPLEIEPLVEKIGMAYDYKSAQQKRACPEENERMDKKGGRRRFFSMIYDVVYGSRRDRRAKSKRFHRSESKER